MGKISCKTAYFQIYEEPKILSVKYLNKVGWVKARSAKTQDDDAVIDSLSNIWYAVKDSLRDI